jgi:CRISPR/Cas system-associated protein Cas5 (RAMP superfamily)
MTDLGEALEEIESLQEKEFRLLGVKVTPATLAGAFALLSTVIGALYGGFLIYQKVEEVANLDLGAYQQQMEVMDAKVSGMAAKVEEAVEYSRDIKNGLRDDILRIEQQADRVEDMVRDSEDKVRVMIDDAEVRFETQRDRLRMSQDADMKDLEGRLTEKIQRALDNPLAD